MDFGESQVRITTRKRQGGHMEEDWLPMLDEPYAALLQHRQTAKGEWVFTDPQTGGPYRCRQHWMGGLCSKAALRASRHPSPNSQHLGQ